MPFSEKTNHLLKKKQRVIILGCGISGATAAQEFTKAGYEVVVLEKENRVGGKIFTLYDLNAELGAVVFLSNYPVIDTLIKNKMSVDNVLPSDTKSINYSLYGKENPTRAEKTSFATHFCYELAKYSLMITAFDYKNDKRTFYQFLKDNNCLHLARFLELWIPGMGYGPLDVIPLCRVLNYAVAHPFNIFATATGFFGEAIKHVHGGYQSLIEKMIEGYDVRLSVNIEQIIRNTNGVSVTFNQAGGETQTLNADLLVLTMSPYWWKELPMNLTELEKKCVAELQYVRYPVAVCDIKGFPPKQYFKPEALKKEGLGHVGFIHTHDDRENPPEGRRCIVYVNLPNTEHHFSLENGHAGRESLLEDLKKIGYSEVNIIAVKDWKDYNPSLSKEISDLLEASQGIDKTLYLGPYSFYSFETVADTENYARKVCRCILKMPKNSYLTNCFHSTIRAIHFFRDLPQATNKRIELKITNVESENKSMNETLKCKEDQKEETLSKIGISF